MRCLERALSLLDPVVSPRPFLAAVHNMAFYLQETAKTRGDDLEAGRWLTLAGRQHARFPKDVNLLKFLMLEGAMAIRLGDRGKGLRKLWQAYRGFEKLGSAHDQLLVLQELADLLLARGETQNVKRIAGRMFPILRRLEVDRETSAALRLFHRAAQTEAATPELIDRVRRTMGERRPSPGSGSSP